MLKIEIRRRRVKMKRAIRWIFYLIGLWILALGIILNTKSNLGVSPIISVPYSISNILEINFSDITMILYVIFVAIEMILHVIWYFKDGKTKCLGLYLVKDVMQIPVSILFTRFLNIFSVTVPSVYDNFLLQSLMLLLAIILTGIGGAISLNMRIVPDPGYGIVQAISDTTKLHNRPGKDVGFCKNCFDILNVCITFTIGLVSGNPLLGLGLGTMLSMFGVGRVIAIFNKMFKDKMEKVTDINAVE